MTPPKPTIREKSKVRMQIENLIDDNFLPRVTAGKEKMFEKVVDKLFALLSPQTGEGECKHDQKGAFKKHCPDCGEQNLCYYCVDKHQCHPTAEEMEKDFWLMWGLAPKGTLKYCKGMTVLAFLRKQLDLKEKEICICAAVRMSDGYIVRGHRHNDCYRTITGIPRYRGIMPDAMEDGFMTTKNRFVDRKEALKLQIKAGLKSKDRIYRGNELFSEDLY